MSSSVAIRGVAGCGGPWPEVVRDNPLTVSGELYSYECLRSVMFAAQEAQRNDALQLELGHALMGLARELATPLPPNGAGPPLPAGGLPVVEVTPLAGLVLGEVGVTPAQLAGATVAAYGVIAPEDLSADPGAVPVRPQLSAEMDRAATREILSARKAHQNHVNSRDRLLSLIIPRGHLPSGQLLDILEIRRHGDLEDAAQDALAARRAALNESLFAAADADPALAGEMAGLFPGARGMARRRRRRRG